VSGGRQNESVKVILVSGTVRNSLVRRHRSSALNLQRKVQRKTAKSVNCPKNPQRFLTFFILGKIKDVKNAFLFLIKINKKRFFTTML